MGLVAELTQPKKDQDSVQTVFEFISQMPGITEAQLVSQTGLSAYQIEQAVLKLRSYVLLNPGYELSLASSVNSNLVAPVLEKLGSDDSDAEKKQFLDKLLRRDSNSFPLDEFDPFEAIGEMETPFDDDQVAGLMAALRSA